MNYREWFNKKEEGEEEKKGDTRFIRPPGTIRRKGPGWWAYERQFKRLIPGTEARGILLRPPFVALIPLLGGKLWPRPDDTGWHPAQK